jgi:hypothetical protein
MFVFRDVEELISRVQEIGIDAQQKINKAHNRKGNDYLVAVGKRGAVDEVLELLQEFREAKEMKPIPGEKEGPIQIILTKCQTGLGTHWEASLYRIETNGSARSTGRTPEEAIGRLYTEHLYKLLVVVRNE